MKQLAAMNVDTSSVMYINNKQKATTCQVGKLTSMSKITT